MRAISAVGLALAGLLVLSGCLQTDAGSSASAASTDTETLVAADRLLQVYPASGEDTPPGGGVIRTCSEAASGLCVVEVGQFVQPLVRTGDGWQFRDSAGNATTLAADGSGQTTMVGGGGFAIRWATQPWGT